MRIMMMLAVLLASALSTTPVSAGKKETAISTSSKATDAHATKCENIEMKVGNIDSSIAQLTAARKTLVEEYIKIYASYGLDPSKKDHISADGTITKAPAPEPAKK